MYALVFPPAFHNLIFIILWFFFMLKTLFNAYGRLRQQRAFVLMVRKIPVPTRRISITGPQTKVSILSSTAVREFTKLFI